MSDAKSIQRLTDELVNAGVTHVARSAAGGDERAFAAGAGPRPTAIVGVHGISPQQQYGFQDQLAMGFLSYLNALEKTTESKLIWLSTPYWPRVSKHPGNPVLKPSALRLYRSDEVNPEEPAGKVYDVYEGYWSPFSKGKTNIASLLGWLLRCTFLATSSTANVPASWPKLRWDLGYLFAALGIAVICLAGAFMAGTFAWGQFLAVFSIVPQPHPLFDFGSFFAVLLHPVEQFKLLSWPGWLQLGLDIVLAYLIYQLYIVMRTRQETSARTQELRLDGSTGGHFQRQTIDAEQFHLAVLIMFALLVGALLLLDVLMLQRLHPGRIVPILWHSVWLVVTIAALQKARSIADFVVEDVLGDVQVYCTHDCNSSFYAVRSQIIDAVTTAVLGALKAVQRPPAAPAGGAPKAEDDDDDASHENLPLLYDKIHVAGHSLGTTVALDVLIRVRQFVEEGSVLDPEWSRIRSFTTFGTALEKTRFLLDVRNPTISAAQQQWQNDAYGRFFTDQRAALRVPDNRDGIFWSNHWYFNDIVANKIVTYKSDVSPGQAFGTWAHPTSIEHPICEDNQIPNSRPFWDFVHGDYIADPLFWKNAGPVFMS